MLLNTAPGSLCPQTWWGWGSPMGLASVLGIVTPQGDLWYLQLKEKQSCEPKNIPIISFWCAMKTASQENIANSSLLL